MLNLLIRWFWCALVRYSVKHNSINFVALWDNQSLLSVAWHSLWLHLRNLASYDHPVNPSSFLPAVQTHPQKERAPKAAAASSSSSTGSWRIHTCSSAKTSWSPLTWGIVVWRPEVRFCSGAEFWFPQNLGVSWVLLPCCAGSCRLSLETCCGAPRVLVLCNCPTQCSQEGLSDPTYMTFFPPKASRFRCSDFEICFRQNEGFFFFKMLHHAVRVENSAGKKRHSLF